MTKQEMAAKLTGREIGNEITDEEERLARKSRLVVIFGGSDDLCELRGAISDECGAPGEVRIGIDGKLLPEIDEDDAEVLDRHGVLSAARKKAAISIEALWCAEDGYSWTYKTDAPHATFEVMEDGEYFCRGIVIDLRDLSS